MQSVAAAITRFASSQTYHTIRLLVDPARREDAFRAYAYFRWVDDVVDRAADGTGWDEAHRHAATAFLARQQCVLDRALDGASVSPGDAHEGMLIELLDHDRDPALQVYLRQMMRVMDFDVRRRGAIVTSDQLETYTHALAVAVTEAMHHFIGHGCRAPQEGIRYLAVTGAHILHMLRDTYQDLAAGYINVPEEVLAARGIAPTDVLSAPYRDWVATRVRLARRCLRAGRHYFARCASSRYRIAGLAYIARFELLADQLVRDGFRIRTAYPEPSVPRVAVASLRGPR
jgi:phytoene/squalene synthetase